MWRNDLFLDSLNGLGWITNKSTSIITVYTTEFPMHLFLAKSNAALRIATVCCRYYLWVSHCIAAHQYRPLCHYSFNIWPATLLSPYLYRETSFHRANTTTGASAKGAGSAAGGCRPPVKTQLHCCQLVNSSLMMASCGIICAQMGHITVATVY